MKRRVLVGASEMFPHPPRAPTEETYYERDKLIVPIGSAPHHVCLGVYRRDCHHCAEECITVVPNVEEHTITQSVLALEQPAAWKALESFAGY